MTTQSNVGDQTPGGAGENTNSPVSQENGQPIAGTPQSSQELLEIRKQLELTRKELQGLQSRQDKEQNETQRFMAEVKKQMANGKSFEEAEAAVLENRKVQDREELLFKIARKVGVLDDVSQTPAGNGGNVTNFKAQVIQKAQLDANAPEVLQLLQQVTDDFDFALKVGELKARSASRPAPDIANASTITAAPARGDKAADIEKGYLEEIAKVRRGNTHEASMVKAKWRKIAREAGFNLNV